jgi:hypothetical protein
MTRFAATIFAGALLPAALSAQPSAPAQYQTITCVKLLPGKSAAEYQQFMADTLVKVNQTRADAGEIVAWSLLRSVMPAGEDARCDFMSSTITDGPPRETGAATFGENLRKAGVNMTADQYMAKRNSLTRLVAMELWRPRIRVGQPKKGHYLFLNYMRVHHFAEYAKFENEVWKPLAEHWVGAGELSGWLFATKQLPAGTEVKYAAMSADIFPSWDAVFKGRDPQTAFPKVHPGKDYKVTMGGLGKLRDLAERHLMVIVERAAKQ